MKTTAEISDYLRYVADLYFARYETGGRDKNMQVRGFAFAKAADAILNGQVDASGKFIGVGDSIHTVIKEFVTTGQSARMAGLQTAYVLPDDIQAMASLPGLTVPFLASLVAKFKVSDKAGLVAALPAIQADNKAVGLRLQTALLVDAARREAPSAGAEQKTLDALKLDGAQTGRLPSDRENKP